MTNWGFDDGQTDDQDNANSNGSGGLRQFAEKQQQENKDLKAQLANIQNQLNRQALLPVFNELGAPGAAALYDGDADPAKAKAWLDEQRKLFGVDTQGAPSTPAVDVPAAEPMPTQLQQKMEAFTQAGQSGTPLGSVEQAYANVSDANDLQSLINAMKFPG